MMIDQMLYQFANVKQLEILEAVEKYGSARQAALALGLGKTTVTENINKVKAKAAEAGYAPENNLHHPIADGLKLAGTSTYFNKDGKVTAQWVKTKEDKNKSWQQLQEFAATLAEGVKGIAAPVPSPEYTNDDLMVVIPIGDPHFGMYAWAEEAGQDFDLELAERLTCGAIDRLLSSGPKAATAVLLNLGDHFHADNQKNTTQSGHQLDVDGRWAKVQQVGLRAMIYCINRLLEKYPKVVFRINKGNHDGHSSYALALMVSCYFHNEPRVEVDLSPAVAWYYQFGKVLIGSTHGDTLKMADMQGVMATDKPESWGTSKHRYWYVGHVHHKHIKEFPGCIVEYARTLVPRDAWHQGQGYRAGRDMQLIVHHREYGEIERHRCDAAMIL